MARIPLRSALTWSYNRLIPSLLALMGVVGLWFAGQRAEPYAYNLFLKWSAKPATESQVTLVLIDDESLTRLKTSFGIPPWPRKSYIQIFERLQQANPSLMVFDSHFVSLDQGDDARFFTELKRFPNLIGGLVMEEAGFRKQWMNTNQPQYYRLNLGVVSMREDPDGFVRSIKPVYHMQTGMGQMGVFPSISLAAAFETLSRSTPGAPWNVSLETTGNLRLYAETKPEAGLTLPLNQNDSFYLRWYSLIDSVPGEYQHSHQAIPLWRFFEKGQNLPSLKGKIMLIGSSSTFYRDYHQTPMSNRHLGPDIHATAIDNILNGQAVRKASFWLNLAILAFLCQVIFWLRFWIGNFGKTALYTLGGMVIYCWMAFRYLAEQSVWLDVVTPEMFIVVAFLAGSTFRILLKEKQLAVTEKNLAQLVDPDVFREIRRLSHTLKPGGEKLEITSMFVDIRNFTSLAERLQPNEVTEVLNEFYGVIVSLVFNYQGTIDKFMGDGILVIFGAPLPNPEHRALALQAANEILKATNSLSQRWQATYGLDTDIGITLNSGMAFVGFLGPADKLEYTGVGDTVNICVRLQEHAKQFKTRLIISQQTLEGLPEKLAHQIPPGSYIPLGEVAVRGREGSIHIFTLKHAFFQEFPSG